MKNGHIKIIFPSSPSVDGKPFSTMGTKAVLVMEDGSEYELPGIVDIEINLRVNDCIKTRLTFNAIELPKEIKALLEDVKEPWR